MNIYNRLTSDLTDPIPISNLHSDSFLIDNFNQQLFDCYSNNSVSCSNNANYNNSNEIPDEQQFVFSSQENFNIFDDEFDPMLLNLDSNVTTSMITTPTLSISSINSISPSHSNESSMQGNSLTTLMEIPTDQFYTSDVHDLNVIIDDIADDSISLQSDSFSSNSSPRNQSSSVDNYSLSSSSLNSPISENSDEYKVENRKTVTTKKRKNKTQDTNLTERQLRKREQNRQAALRYRLKKKNEAKNIESEEKQLLDDIKNLQNEIRKMQQSSECYENLFKEIMNMNN